VVLVGRNMDPSVVSFFVAFRSGNTSISCTKIHCCKKSISVAPETGAGVGELVPRAQKGVQKTMRD
jgi:hypothetical protein